MSLLIAIRMPCANELVETRHACDQGDALNGYTWTTYDAREGGVQVIKDSRNNVKLTTEFLKIPDGHRGGSWAARIKGEPLEEGQLCDQGHSEFVASMWSSR